MAATQARKSRQESALGPLVGTATSVEGKEKEVNCKAGALPEDLRQRMKQGGC